MSLFHVSDWYNSLCPGATSMVVAQLIEDRDQLIVGSLKGILTILDPGGNVEHRHEMAAVVEKDLKMAVLQVSAGKFLSIYDRPVIVVLHPHTLVYFRLISNNEESFMLDRVSEHRLHGEPAFNMCQGYFGGSNVEQICVQSISCTLNVFEGENRVLGRQITDAIHPGPMEYTPYSESILLTSGGYLSSVRYTVLISNASLQHQLPSSNSVTGKNRNAIKKLNPDWSVNLGDTALAVKVIGVLPIQPSIVVLCKRVVFCITHGGEIRYLIRLQCVALCMMINCSNNSAEIQICVGVSTKTLLFYHDTKMVWNAQLSFAPIYVNITNFSESLRSLLTMLSDNGHVVVGVLGTEPSLFRMPVTECRYIDFERRRSELRQFEEIIWRAGHNAESETVKLRVEVEVNMDEQSVAENVGVENVPSATFVLNFSNVRDCVDVVFQGAIFAHKTNFSFTSNEAGTIPISVYCNGVPTLDLRCQITAVTNTAESLMTEILLPLSLVCRKTISQKSANFKLTLTSSHSCLNITELFDDSYRVQSNSTDFLFVVFSELVRRIQIKQPNVSLHCQTPLHMVLHELTSYLKRDSSYREAERNVSRIAIQMRQAETVMLSKLKSDREPFASHLSALINYTYNEMMSALDKLAAIDTQMAAGEKRSMQALLNLLSAVLELSPNVKLPFDGRILDGMNMPLGEMMQMVLMKDGNESFTGLTSHEENVVRMLMAHCERGDTEPESNTLPDLREEEEEKYLEESKNPMIEEKEEFFELKSGSLPYSASSFNTE